MRIDLKQTFKDLDGQIVRDLTVSSANEKPVDAGPLTVRKVFIRSLMTWFDSEKPTAEDKLQCYQIGVKMDKDAKEINFTSDQLSFIKNRVGVVYGPLIYGRVKDLIDGVDEDEVEEGDSKKAKSK